MCIRDSANPLLSAELLLDPTRERRTPGSSPSPFSSSFSLTRDRVWRNVGLTKNDGVDETIAGEKPARTEDPAMMSLSFVIVPGEKRLLPVASGDPPIRMDLTMS